MKIGIALQKILGNSNILCNLDSLLIKKQKNKISLPIFIIGAPRSGSTVLFQAIISKYQVSYLSNIHALFCKQICIASKIVKIMHKFGFQYHGSFKSHYGFSPGFLGPSEGGVTFRDWFGDADFNPGEHALECDKIKCLVSSVCKINRGPFISKNLFNSMRLFEITKCFPDPFFIWIQRDTAATAQSILNMRKKQSDDVNTWVSVEVPNQEKLLELPPLEQVVWQVVLIERYIEEFFLKQNSLRCIKVRYEDFCAKPEEIIDELLQQYAFLEGVEVPTDKNFRKELFNGIHYDAGSASAEIVNMVAKIQRKSVRKGEFVS